MTAVARMQLEHQFSLLKLEHAKRIADINQHFRTLRYEARNELADKIAKISKVYHDVININKQQRQSLWVEKCRLESATPVDVDAIADNRAEHNELKRHANVLSTQLDADIKALKRDYSYKKNRVSRRRIAPTTICRRGHRTTSTKLNQRNRIFGAERR